jgi:hypothetical protein
VARVAPRYTNPKARLRRQRGESKGRRCCTVILPGSVTVFRGGEELDGADASMAIEEFMARPVVEILGLERQSPTSTLILKTRLARDGDAGLPRGTGGELSGTRELARTLG